MSIEDLGIDILLQGQLSEHAMIEVLGVLFKSKKSGELKVIHGKIENKIYAQSGIPVYAYTSSTGDTLLEVMSRDKRLTSEDLVQIKQVCEEKHLSVEECLEQVFETPAEELAYYLAQATKEIIVKTCGYRQGQYSFVEFDGDMSGIPRHNINPLELIYEGMSRYHIANLAQELYQLENRDIALNRDLGNFFLLPGPYYERSDILDLFQERMRVSQAIVILQNEFQDINKAIDLLYLLMVTGVIELMPDPDAIDDTLEIVEVTPSRYQEDEGSDIQEIVPDDDEDIEEIVADGDYDLADIGAIEDKRRDHDSKPESRKSSAGNSKNGQYHRDDIYAGARGQKNDVSNRPIMKVFSKKDKSAGDKEPPKREVISSVSIKRSGAEKKAKEPAKKKEEVKAAPKREVVRPAEKKPVAARPSSAPEKPAGKLLDLRDSEIKRFYEYIENSHNLYDVLDVSVEDSPSKIQDAYSRKMKILGKDDLQTKMPEEIEEMLQEIEERLEDALTTLANPELRIEYERDLFEEEKKRTWNLKLRKALAGNMQVRGKWYLNQNAPAFAIECFEQAIELDPEHADNFMLLGWSTFRYQPALVEKAKTYLNSALEINPRLDMAYYYLGLIAKKESNDEEAEKSFQKALELNPSNLSAQRELSYLTQQSSQGSLWKKIFS